MGWVGSAKPILGLDLASGPNPVPGTSIMGPFLALWRWGQPDPYRATWGEGPWPGPNPALYGKEGSVSQCQPSPIGGEGMAWLWSGPTRVMGHDLGLTPNMGFENLEVTEGDGYCHLFPAAKFPSPWRAQWISWLCGMHLACRSEVKHLWFSRSCMVLASLSVHISYCRFKHIHEEYCGILASFLKSRAEEERMDLCLKQSLEIWVFFKSFLHPVWDLGRVSSRSSGYCWGFFNYCQRASIFLRWKVLKNCKSC